jgi:hypothetical protein
MFTWPSVWTIRVSTSVGWPLSSGLDYFKSTSFPGCIKSFFVPNMSRSSQNKPKSFCYICGKVVLKSQRKTLSQFLRNLVYSLWAVRSEIMIKFGRRRFAKAHVQGPVERYPKANAFCCSDSVAWASRPLNTDVFAWQRSLVSPDFPCLK